MKKKYLEKGFVFVDVSNPEIFFSRNKDSASVVYDINEQKRCVLRKINIEGVDMELANKIRNELSNKEGNPLNILEIENDIKKSIGMVRQEGYFFAKIKNSLEQDIVVYSPKGASSEINIGFSLGKKGLYKKALIRGNLYTESHVIEREITLKKNEIVTLEKN